MKDQVVNLSDKIISDSIVLNGTAYVDCDFPNVIYLIPCKRYSLKHGGRTVQNLKEGLTDKVGFDQPSNYELCRMLSDNFHKGICRNATYSFPNIGKVGQKCYKNQKCFGCLHNI